MATADRAPATGSLAVGYVCGLIMALGASVSFAAARAGVLSGLGPDDMIFARFVVAGLVLLPLLLWWGATTLAGIGWWRGLALLATGGPLFAILQTGGYAFAPLAHGAIIAPSTVTLLSTIGAGLLLGERLTRAHLIGACLVLAGIALIGGHGLLSSPTGASAWIGDLLFFASSVLWAGFTLLIRYWRVDAMRATVVVCVLSMCVTTPAYLIFRGPEHLIGLPLLPLVIQGVVQGLLQAIITLVAYARAIAILGVSRAVLFPAIVPAVSILVGIPIVGEVPTSQQIVGLGLVSAGMLIAVGILGRLRAAPARAKHGS